MADKETEGSPPVAPPGPVLPSAVAPKSPPTIPFEDFERLKADLEALKQTRSGPADPTDAVDPKAKDEHEADEQKWWLRYVVAGVVILTLWAELLAIFVLVLLQGFGGLTVPYVGSFGFKLDPWLFGVLVVGVLIQTIWCLQNIAAHLFPEGEKKLETVPKPPEFWK